MRGFVTQKLGKIFIFVLAGILGVMALVRWQFDSAPVFAQSLDQISVSVSMFDLEGAPVNGTYSVRFALYRSNRIETDPFPSESDPRLWEETGEVEVKNGIFRHIGPNGTYFHSF